MSCDIEEDKQKAMAVQLIQSRRGAHHVFAARRDLALGYTGDLCIAALTDALRDRTPGRDSYHRLL